MSKKFLKVFVEKSDDHVSGTVPERRLSMSKSGRLKQKNKQREALSKDLFADEHSDITTGVKDLNIRKSSYPSIDTILRQSSYNQEEPIKKVTHNNNNINTMDKETQERRREEPKDEEIKEVYETAL